MMIYNNKTIFYIGRSYWTKEIDTSFFPYNFNGDIMFNIGDNFPNIQDILKNVMVDNVEENSTLYFGKTSKFPRYKIKDLNYNRCIKVDKSDYQVIGNIIYSRRNNLYLFENDITYYCIFELEDVDVIKDTNFSLKRKIKYIEEKFKVTFCGILKDVGVCSKLVWEDLSKILNGEFTKCITDEKLDIAVNRKIEPMTKDDVDLLYDLLNSSDKASIDLGLQMLVGYDVSEVPCTIRLLLRKNKIKEGKAWNSTGVKQVRNSINLNYTGWMLRYKDSNAFDNYNNISDRDKELSYYLWSKIIIEHANKELEQYNLPGLIFKCHVDTK